MKIFKHTFLAVIAISLMGAFATQVQAQSNEERRAAVQAYNNASELAKQGNYDQAISKFEEAIEAGQAAEEAGQQGADIVERAQSKIPAIYYDKAINAYRTFQNSQTLSNLETTIAAFRETADAAEQFGNEKIGQQATSNITKLTYAKSRLQYSQKNYDEALTTINTVIEENPNYATAYYHKGLILKKQEGNLEKALEIFDKAIEVAEENNNSEIARKARENATGELIYQGAQMVQEKNYSGGIELLNRALEYDSESADAHYRLAQAYNKRGDWAQGLEHGQKALELENGGRTDKAKIYFEIASAYKGQGNFQQACDAYSNAAYGSFKQPAEHQMEFELNCKSL